METLEFTKEETLKLRRIAEYYRVAKELIIYGEQIDPNGSTLSQTLGERVNALDHIIRVISQKLEMRDVVSANHTEYNAVSLDKAYGHIYRAAYDALDWVSLTIQERLAADINFVSLETITAVMPEYYTSIKPDIEKILRDDITFLRNNKDVADDNEENFKRYVETVLKIKQLFDQVQEKVPSLNEYEQRRKHRESRGTTKQIVIKVVGGIIAGMVLIGIGWLIAKYTGVSVNGAP